MRGGVVIVPLGEGAPGFVIGFYDWHGNLAKAAALRDWRVADVASVFHILHEYRLDIGVFAQFQPGMFAAFAVFDRKRVLDFYKLVKL